MAIMAIPEMPKDFWDDMDWTSENYSELMQKYPNEWVTVVNGKIISHGKDLEKIIKLAKRKTGKEHIVVESIEGGGHIYVL